MEGTMSRLSLDQYLDLLAAVPLPTEPQRDGFVDYVAHAHSWYKHVPPFPPGAPFYFFLDKYAGCDRVRLADGGTVLKERAARGFHYSAIPTTEYRRRFGFLAFSCGSGTTVRLVGGDSVVIPRDKTARVPGDDARMRGLPTEILQAGMVRLTGLIHASAAAQLWWNHLERWPEELGGRAVLEKIHTCCRRALDRSPTERQQTMNLLQRRQNDQRQQEMRPEEAMHMAMVDPGLDEIFGPERRRQHGEMRNAIDRMCELVDRQRTR